MDTETLRWFQLVADGMTVTEVAETYAVSQPGVSRALARLEDEVGTPLLRRAGRVLRLTHAGAAFKRHVDALINDLDDGLAAVEHLLDPEAGLITLAFPLSLGSWFIPQRIREFTAAHPATTFTLRRTEVTQSAHPSALLLTREIDLEFTTMRIDHPDVRWQWLTLEPVVLALPAEHRLAGAERLDFGAVADDDLIVPRSPSSMREQVLALAQAARFSPRVAYEVEDLPTARGFVAAGLGVAVVPAQGRVVPSTQEGVAFVPLRDEGAYREIGVAWLIRARLLPAAEAFREYLLARGGPRQG